MVLTKKDFAILDKFDFTVQPVGVKFFFKQPGKINRLDGKMTFCEMLKRAQEGKAFYADAENHTCGGGSYVLGQADLPLPAASGDFIAATGGFAEPRAGNRFYRNLPKIEKGVVNYVAFSVLDQLTFDPDVLVILTNKTEQTEIILRALSYKTAKIWVSKTTNGIGCAWLFVYPYLTGEVNYIVTGISHGMKRRKLFPEGLQLISIPFDVLPSILQTLQEMPWIDPTYGPDGQEIMRRALIDSGLGENYLS